VKAAADYATQGFNKAKDKAKHLFDRQEKGDGDQVS
jgi:hypothetical protein